MTVCKWGRLQTFRTPSRVNVYCSPILRMSLNTDDIIRDQIAIGRGMVITIDRDMKIAVHTSPDRRESKSITRDGQCYQYCNNNYYAVTKIINTLFYYFIVQYYYI